MKLKELDSNSFEKEIKKGIVLVEMYGAHCPPCKRMLPELESVEIEGVTIAKLLVDENPDIAEMYTIMSTPTVIIFKDGDMVARQSGFMNRQQITEMINGI